MILRRTVPNALSASLVLLLLVVAGMPTQSGADAPRAGHWDELGEDGRIWVPAERPDATTLPEADLGAYHNHTEMTDALVALATARPELFTLGAVGTSVEGRALWMMRVTGPGDASDRPRVLFDGAHHGNEVIGSETLIRFLQAIDAGYDTDAAMRDILAAVVIEVVPMVNVDSVQRIPQCDHYALCRKNTNGVDLNRNYADHWGGSGSSGSPGGATYRGPSPLSEPETQAIAFLLDTRGYALHASFHSGTELILWPYGWTTTAPAETALYASLGDELTALTGVANGQTSKILYAASGTTMDQAYGAAAGWRPVSFSPEAYVGSGSAYDWWGLFNPVETEAAIGPVVARWLPFLWHLAEEAPGFRPALIDVPEALSIGPDMETISVGVTPPVRRPFIDASVRFDALEAPVRVESANPVSLSDGGGLRSAAFSLLVERGGAYVSRVVLDAGPAGTLERSVSLSLQQVGLSVALDRSSMGTPHDNEVSVSLSAGPFDSVEGVVTVRAEPGGHLLGTAGVQAVAGTPDTVSLSFDATGLSHGQHRVVATAEFSAMLDGTARTGVARAETTLVVERPEVVAQKHFTAESPKGQPLPVLGVYRNDGNLVAEDLVVRERVPPGYTYWVRDGPVPIPQEPLGAPMPDEVSYADDGSVWLTWRFGDLQPGASVGVRYRVLPLVPGTSLLSSQWDYVGDFGDQVVGFDDSIAPTHRAR